MRRVLYIGGFDLEIAVPNDEGEDKVVSVPEKALRNFIIFLNHEASARSMNLKSSDSGLTSLELELVGKKGYSWHADKIMSNLCLHFAGPISLEFKAGAIKFGELYSELRIGSFKLC